ncbi:MULTISPECIES: hypothetical protein [unclassified Bradyrhizobium]|uniref:hypothetical protein n=1 Tax=unclassified Bradyrhizobium TaxID=2631580 RepID=UPI0028EA51B9|nr:MULTISPECIES: hypothetical protein [unclassified Bradyrhizobium]
MSRLWFIVWAIVIWQVAVRTWTPAATPTPESFTPISGIEFDEHEKYIEDARRSNRKDALAALDRPWSERCGPNRPKFIGGLNAYYRDRQNQHDRYPEIYGPAGADYIAKQWDTPDDRRIVRLTQEAFANGYLRLSDFDGLATEMVSAVVLGERVTGRGCAA